MQSTLLSSHESVREDTKKDEVMQLKGTGKNIRETKTLNPTYK